jgi:hypothetical protein
LIHCSLGNPRSRKTVAGLIFVHGRLKASGSLDKPDVGERELLLLPPFVVIDVSIFYQSFLDRQTTSLLVCFRQGCGRQR